MRSECRLNVVADGCGGVLAQGRWRSDVWQVYCRRDPKASMEWARRILGGVRRDEKGSEC